MELRDKTDQLQYMLCHRRLNLPKLHVGTGDTAAMGTVVV